MIHNHHVTPIFNGYPITRESHLATLANSLTANQLEQLDNGDTVKLSAKQEILLTVQLFWS